MTQADAAPASLRSSGWTCRILDSRAALESIAGEWNALLQSTSADSIFLTWEWISSWLEIAAPRHLFVIAVFDHDRQLTGVAPYYIARLSLGKLISYRTLRALGDFESGAEYPDLIIRRGCEDQVIELIARVLREHAREWDCIWLKFVAAWTGAEGRHDLLAHRCGAVRRSRPCVFSVIELPSTHDAFVDSLPREPRRRLRKETAALFAEHNAELVSDWSGASSLATLVRLHDERWSSVGQPGAFNKHLLMTDFYHCFGNVAAAHGWLRMYTLVVGGVPRAVQVGYSYRREFLQMQEGYDPALPGIGNVARLLAIERLIAEGHTIYDFLGGYSEHKRRWRAKKRWGVFMLIVRDCLKTLPLRHVWPTGRWMIERLDRTGRGIAAQNSR